MATSLDGLDGFIVSKHKLISTFCLVLLVLLWLLYWFEIPKKLSFPKLQRICIAQWKRKASFFTYMSFYHKVFAIIYY